LDSTDTVALATSTSNINVLTSTGYTLLNGDANDSPNTFVSWNWKAGGAAVTNTAGTEDTSVSANTTAGFSIVKYTGTGGTATFGHGLSAAPDIVFMKSLDATAQWMGYIGNIVSENNLVLNSTAVASTESSYTYGDFGASTFALNLNADNNASGDDFVAYCFHSIEGYSKVGSYEGNGNVDGSFIYTGFRPAFIMTKSIDSTSDWQMFDDKREGYNVDNDVLLANDGAAETTTDYIDIVSNGFKNRIATDPNVAETYIYIAFAESPFKTSNAR
jgi:hypothetical protein